MFKYKDIQCPSAYSRDARQELIHALGVIQSLKVHGKSKEELPCNKLLTIYRSPVYLLIQSLAERRQEQE